MKLTIRVSKITDELYIGSCRELKGCHVEAKTEDGVRNLLKVAINAYVLSHKQRHEKISYQSGE
ncbi:MAG TPA: hypothetical protein PKV71_08180 [Calditrichia bacterium]|nr:type II toxin-antitoxin system HicB family antitoxin [Calditrichota bacterium]HQV31840.1 hypothetical protein [Calditrichia bacterium]